MSAEQVIGVLDETIDWYRTLGIQQQVATEPSDLLFLYDDRQTAAKIIALAFDMARADADLLGSTPTTSEDAGDETLSSQTLTQFSRKLDAQRATVQAQLDDERRLPLAGSSKRRATAQARIHELQSELDLLGAKQSMLDTLAQSVARAGDSSTGSLKAQIDAMAVAIPSAGAASTVAAPSAAGSPGAGGNAAAAAASLPLGQPTAMPPTVARLGLWDLAANAYRLSEKAGTVTAVDQRSAALQTTLSQIRDPLIEQLKALSARGDALATRADSADGAALNGFHDELDALAAEFKQASTLLVPLSRESVLLHQYRRTLGNWRASIEGQYRSALRTLGIRLCVVLAILAVVFAAAELWRRTVTRYIQDARRRYQLLLLRRIALWSLVILVVGIAFASELSSIVTFAGLITAGIAVAMQSVLVSIVGYFFLIGKYGIRIGDRVQIGDVVGEVIEVGLVRLYLMELGAKGTLGPTGRVVAFSNSLVFQVSSGLFKQIPGVNFAWREVVLNLPLEADYAAIKEKLQSAVTAALVDYRAEIVRQTQEIERTTLSSSAGDAKPQVQLRFAAGAVEAHVRYPVHLKDAAEIDERVTEALAHAVAVPAG